MQYRFTTCLLVSSLLLVGCASRPKALISYIEKPSDLVGDELDTYAFPRTILEVKQEEKGGGVSVETKNQSYEKFRIGLRRNDSFGIRTNLNITKKQNSDMIDAAGVSVTDNRIKLIGEIGKLAKTVIGLGVVPFSGGLSLPYSVDTTELAEGIDRTGMDVGKWKEKGELSYWFGPIQPDARRVTASAFNGFDSGIVYAACREMKIRFQVPKSVKKGETPEMLDVEKNVYVSEPRYFRFVAFPQKGKVAVHDQCGVSVTTEKDESIQSNFAIAEALFQQIGEVKKAVEEQNKDENKDK